MNASWWRRPTGVRGWLTPRAAAGSIVVGGILGLIAIIASALNAVSAQQAIVLAVPATVLAIGGLIGWLIPGRAWRS
jgi:uncharacterized membrane protein (UPF0136 family)